MFSNQYPAIAGVDTRRTSTLAHIGSARIIAGRSGVPRAIAGGNDNAP
ncbi:hypothetical protein N8677_01380 [Verrucomicrobia bacterium]|nr:hypothetical protein [Verrucomicrobiota bacterium]